MNNAVCYSNGPLKAIEWESAGTNCPVCSTIHSTSQTLGTRQASQLLGTKLCDLTMSCGVHVTIDWYSRSVRGVATIEATEATTLKASIACNSLDFPNSYSHAIDMPKFSQCLSKKYTVATPLGLSWSMVKGSL